MTSLATILSTPIKWQTAAVDPDLRAFLQDLQANILKGHGRFHTGHIFVGFGGMAPEAIASLLRTLGQHCTSAYQQLRTNKRFPPHLDAGVVRCLFLSASGYRALGPLAELPAGAAFGAGMGQRTAVLADPARAAWSEVGWRNSAPDAMILVADANPQAVTDELERVEAWLGGTGAKVLFVERGFQQSLTFRPGQKAEGVEHFGYVDGRSQPLVLADDAAAEPHQTFKSAFAPKQFIVADPNGQGPLSAGSYFVFRKLEQNVRGFNKAEDELGKKLFGNAAPEAQLERAGAMVVGRFEDGTPLVLAANAQGQAVPNDFNYDSDPDGAKCPFHAHIRKTNPRGDIKRALPQVDASADRDPIMIRRGITYGAPRPKTADGSEFADDGHEPVQHSGLLFMAYMASLEAQFEFTQQSWANNVQFAGNLDPSKPRPPTGVDPVIGQSNVAADHAHSYKDGWTAGAQAKTLSFQQFVTMKGGEYFFAPSLSFLRAVGL